MKKLFHSKVWGPLFIMLLSLVFSMVLGGVLWLIAQKHFLRICILLFLLFGAPVFLTGVFLLLGIARDHEIGASCGFYYGGTALTALIQGPHSTVEEFFLGFGIAAVIVYLVISKRRKP